MEINDDVRHALEEFIAEWGEKELLRRIRIPSEAPTVILSIVVDRTLHEIPSEQLIGDIFDFSEGNIMVEKDGELTRYMTERLKILNHKLREKKWNRVRVIISGHAILSMYVKILVYRILHIDTEDVGFFGKHGYKTVSINIRSDVFS